MADIRAKLIGLCEAFNAHDLDRVMNFFADDCILEMPRGPHAWGARYQGKQAVREGLASRFEGLPDVHYGNGQHFVDQVNDVVTQEGQDWAVFAEHDWVKLNDIDDCARAEPREPTYDYKL